MEYLIGVGLAVLVCVFAALVGFDRERVFYPSLVTVIATYYVLFAVIAGSYHALAFEALIAAAFFAMVFGGTVPPRFRPRLVTPGRARRCLLSRRFDSGSGLPQSKDALGIR